MTTVVFNGTVYTCPLSDRFRRHTSEELDRMCESVAAGGVQVPVWLYFDTTLNLDDCVLDGEGRLTAAVAGNCRHVPFHFAGAMSTEEAYERARVLNDHRRQDTPDAIRTRRAERVARVVAAREQGHSLRAIAGAERVSEAQVRADLRDATAQGCAVAAPERVTGLDGRGRPATRPDTDTQLKPAHFRPGFNGDPDHPFARSLNAMTALVKALNADMRADESGFLKSNLSLLTRVPVQQRQVLHTSGLIRDGQHSPPTAKFVGLALLRSLVRNSGSMKKLMTLAQLKKLCELIDAAPEDQVLTAEGDGE